MPVPHRRFNNIERAAASGAHQEYPMSRKTKRNQADAGQRPPQAPPPLQRGGTGRRGVLIASGAGLLLALGAGAFLFTRGSGGSSPPGTPANRPGLASDHAPTLGDAAAKVHIVEFIDPACETCATFYPLIKQIMADNPNKIRLSIRHLPFHRGASDVVRLLEASRKQGKYWQTLEALLASQSTWVLNHTAYPDRARQAIAGVGLNLDQLAADMNAPEVTQRMGRDQADAETLNVTQTPEYFVNGRQMASFGRKQLQDLVRDALQSAY
jgi:protein-disulfide isomerase